MKSRHRSKYKLSRTGLKTKYPNTVRIPKIMRMDPKKTELDYYGGISRKYHIPRLKPYYLQHEERNQDMRKVYTRDEVIAILKEAKRIRGRVGYRGEGNYVKRGGMMRPVTKGAPAVRKYKMPLKRAVKEELERERLEEELADLLEEDAMEYRSRDGFYEDDYPYGDTEYEYEPTEYEYYPYDDDEDYYYR